MSASEVEYSPESVESGAGVGGLFDDVQLARGKLLSIVESVNNTTEREVLALGACLEKACELGKTFVSETESTLMGLDTDTSLAEAIDGQVRQLSSFQNDLDALDEHAQLAAQRSSSILDASKEVEQVAIASKVLSVNAAIEASRGKRGDAYMVIASEMKSLSVRVEALNRQVQELANELAQDIPRLAEGLQDLRETSKHVQRDLSENLIRLRDQGTDLAGAIRRTSAGGQAMSEAVQATMMDGSAHITFQDPVRQQLLDIDRIMFELEQSAGAACGREAALEAQRAPVQVTLGQSQAGVADAMFFFDDDQEDWEI